MRKGPRGPVGHLGALAGEADLGSADCDDPCCRILRMRRGWEPRRRPEGAFPPAGPGGRVPRSRPRRTVPSAAGGGATDRLRMRPRSARRIGLRHIGVAHGEILPDDVVDLRLEGAQAGHCRRRGGSKSMRACTVLVHSARPVTRGALEVEEDERVQDVRVRVELRHHGAEARDPRALSTAPRHPPPDRPRRCQKRAVDRLDARDPSPRPPLHRSTPAVGELAAAAGVGRGSPRGRTAARARVHPPGSSRTSTSGCSWQKIA